MVEDRANRPSFDAASDLPSFPDDGDLGESFSYTRRPRPHSPV